METDVHVSLVESAAELAQCLEIRFEVFVDEQGVPRSLEHDDMDSVATHVIARDGSGQHVGTARYYPMGSSMKIGRVAVLKPLRGYGVGGALMNFILENGEREGFTSAELNAQSYVVSFYERLGFVAYGEEFEDAGIPHRHMRRELQPLDRPQEGV